MTRFHPSQLHVRMMSLFNAVEPRMCRLQFSTIILALFLIAVASAAPRSRRQTQSNSLPLLSNQEIEPTAAPEVEATEPREGAIPPQQGSGQTTLSGSQPQAASLNSNNNKAQQSPANIYPVQQAPVNNNAFQQAQANNNNGLVQVPGNIEPAPPKTVEIVVRGPDVANSLSQASANTMPQPAANYMPVPQDVNAQLSSFPDAPSQALLGGNADLSQVSPQNNNAIMVSQGRPTVSRNNAIAQRQVRPVNSSGPRVTGTGGQIAAAVTQAVETKPTEGASTNTGRVAQSGRAPAQPGPFQPVVPNLSVNNAPQIAPWVYTAVLPGAGAGIRNANTGRGFFPLMPGREVEAAEAPEMGQAGPFAMPGSQMAGLPNGFAGQMGVGAEMETLMPQAPLMGSLRGFQQPMAGQMAPGEEMEVARPMAMPQAPMPQGQMPQAPMQVFPKGGQPPMGALNPGMEVEPPQVQPPEVEPAEGAGAIMGNMIRPNGQLAPGASPQVAGQQRWPSPWATGNNFGWGQQAF